MPETIDPLKLVLKLSDRTNNIDISKYEDFILSLCGEREYQIESIRKAVKFFISDEYNNTKEIVRKNYRSNPNIHDFYDNELLLINQLIFPDKKSCTIDLATGTGKTWVIYGVARILLAEGLVDNVLILCPSLTIKWELQKKFNNIFTVRPELKNTLDKNIKYRNPGIIDSSKTIKKGDICIDNIHKTYDYVGSSIEDSLKNKDRNILVINDEAHHLINADAHIGISEKSKMLEWYKFLIDENYKFKYILNSTGTPYKGDNYFKDVIYRYSIRQAIEDGYVKDINYIEKDELKGWDQKFIAIYDIHNENKIKYDKAQKHITIFVTNEIVNTDKIADKIRKYLIDKENITEEEARDKVLPVTSSKKHEKNREKLKTVDEPENPVEWIVSVSMLTEGWDVDNVFQIVPHEERAFNSRLLISQVLGRGLRVPDEYKEDYLKPQVTIYNHDAWSENIDDLVIEVAEISKKVISRINPESQYSFSVYYMDIEKKIKSETKTPTKGEVSLPSTLGFRNTKEYLETIFRDVRDRRTRIKRTKVDTKKHTIEKAVNDVFNNIYLLDKEHKKDYTKKVSKEFIRKLIVKELNKIGENDVAEHNLQRAKSSFNTLYRGITGQSTIERLFSDLKPLYTAEMNKTSLSINELKRDKGIMYSNQSIEILNKDELDVLDEVINEIRGRYNIRIDDEKYKSPSSITFLTSKNEIDFAKRLTMEENIENIDKWIKSKDRGFYSIPYIHRPGMHSKQLNFNPDFIIKKNNEKIIIVEIKSDDDTQIKNRDKIVGAESYFKEINKKLNKKKQLYLFHFLSPQNYNEFFQKVIRNDQNFISDLHLQLREMSRREIKGQ
ncbi:MAG: DEAD/DEAH box helicase family protein [Candidatus Cloacimonetes bacterium]|nr:DEAD/DEAH box helicase family protein [Candidatus Cloacimonadota bacterium]